MIKKIYLCFFILLLSCIDSFSQDKKFAIKIAPLCFFDPFYNTIEFALSYKINEQYTVQSQLGYGNIDLSLKVRNTGTFPLESKFNNFRLRSEIRRFLRQEKYLAIEAMYKHSDIIQKDWIGQECDNDNCNFFKIDEGDIKKDVLAFHIKIGREFYTGRFITDVFFGLGIRHVWVNSYFEAIQRNNTQNYINKKTSGALFMPSMTAGFSVGYSF